MFNENEFNIGQFSAPDYIKEICDKWARKFSELDHRARNAEEAHRQEVARHGNTVSSLLTSVCKNTILKNQIAAMEQEHKLNLERIERDTARITQLRGEKDYLKECIRQYELDVAQLRDERDNYKKQIPNPNFIDSRIAEFQRVVKMLRERGDRWKERCMKRREELTLWASRAFKARKERDEARVTIAAQAQVVADQAKRLESMQSDRALYLKMLIREREDNAALMRDLTKALDGRTVTQPNFKRHPGC